eukprot:GEMP01004063.1.p1 GENE.GEMP01004063.1~~GEMP01004063.1.p1  ORF type:complete len:544 (+),score=73.09 GEMP01004063.1:114-1745(+)
MYLFCLALLYHLFFPTTAYEGYVARCVGRFEWDTRGNHSCGVLVHATFDDTVTDRGFGTLKISTLQSPSTDNDYFYAMGYAEGILTAERAGQHLYNMVWTQKQDHRLDDFLKDHWNYMLDQARTKTSDPYWIATGLVLNKAVGLRDGIIARNVSDPILPEEFRHRRPSNLEILKLQLVSDLDDMKAHLDGKYSKTDSKGHCSALIQLTADGEVIAGHATWSAYNEMLRIYKSFTFPHIQSLAIVNKRMSFSSYPGYIASTDDWITLPDRNLLILETTNECMAPDLLSKEISHESVSTPFRSFAATLLAKDGIQWYQHFARENSGTQNNQWMIVNMLEGTLFVIEQMPGSIVARDMTETLRSNRRWASFNQCFFEETCAVSQYYERRSALNACEANRKILFMQAQVASIRDMQTLLTTNDWLHTPLSEECPRCVIASRFDIAGNNPKVSCGKHNRTAFGAIDAKVISSNTIGRDETLFVSGPPRGPGVPPFQWSQSGLDVPHVGLPDRWEFGWYPVGSQARIIEMEVTVPEIKYVREMVSEQYI